MIAALSIKNAEMKNFNLGIIFLADNTTYLFVIINSLQLSYTAET